MKSFKSMINEAAAQDRPIQDEFMAELEATVAEIKKKFPFLEMAVKRSSLSSEKRPSFAIYSTGPKDTWTNGISMNSPLDMNLSVGDGVVEQGRFAYQMRDAGIKKMRKAKYKDAKEAGKKVIAYFNKNGAAMKAMLD